MEPISEEQVKAVCDQETFAGSKIRIMPDMHAGMSCTIGTTMAIVGKAASGMVGVDIGSGMKTVRPAGRKKKGNNSAEDNNKWIPHTT
jgi:RNA-splicing ligase RtcB